MDHGNFKHLDESEKVYESDAACLTKDGTFHLISPSCQIDFNWLSYEVAAAKKAMER